MKNANVEIVKLKVSNKNKKGERMKNQIKLSGIDVHGKEHYLKFCSYDYANDLIYYAKPGEVIDDIKIGVKLIPWMDDQDKALKTQAKIKEQFDIEELERKRKLEWAQINGNVGPYD